MEIRHEKQKNPGDMIVRLIQIIEEPTSHEGYDPVRLVTERGEIEVRYYALPETTRAVVNADGIYLKRFCARSDRGVPHKAAAAALCGSVLHKAECNVFLLHAAL